MDIKLGKSSGIWLHQKGQRLSVVGEGLIFFSKALWGFIVIIRFKNISSIDQLLNFLLIINLYLPYKENYFLV